MVKAATAPAFSFSYGTPKNHEKDPHEKGDAIK
jgi:hypothetical protein